MFLQKMPNDLKNYVLKNKINKEPFLKSGTIELVVYLTDTFIFFTCFYFHIFESLYST